MDILLLDPIRSAGSAYWSDRPARLRTVGSLHQQSCRDAHHGPSRSFQWALVGPDLPEHTLAAITFMRGLMPSTLLIAYDGFDRYDFARQQRILDAGANAVFDIRFSATKIAMLLRPLMRGSIGGLELVEQPVAA